MIYSEATYFDGYHFAHCAAWEEKRRLDRRQADARKAWEGERRRNAGRRRFDMEVTSN
jgi:hypothetical protein